VVLLAAGLALAHRAQIAYQRPWSTWTRLKYLYGASPRGDPARVHAGPAGHPGFGSPELVALAQHSARPGRGGALYAVLLAAAANRWLAAVAVAAVLLDAYQVQIEQHGTSGSRR